MDIWRWVWEVQDQLESDGQKRLSEIMDALPKAIVAGHQEIAEAMLPEGLSLARQVDNPWIEIFLRHWICQGRFLVHNDVTQGLPEVVSLLDFAHGERTRDCPQSVCVVQDICVAYEILDGPGYAVERIAAAQEALDRIDATWPCFGCIGSEHIDALCDAGRYEEAERHCRSHMALREEHEEDPAWNLRLSLATALSEQRKHTQAVSVLDEPGTEPGKEHMRLLWTLGKCRYLALSGRVAEAVKLMVKAEQLDRSHYRLWAYAAEALAHGGGVPNDEVLDSTLRNMTQALRSNGGLHRPAEIAVIGARLAVARGNRGAAFVHLEEAEKILPLLRKPVRLRAAIDEIRAGTVLQEV